MTTAPTAPVASTAGKNTRPFLTTGVFAVTLTALATPLGLLDWMPVIGPLVERGGPVSTIALLVFAASLWILLFALVRQAAGSAERKAVTALREVLHEWPPTGAQELAVRFRTRLSAARLQNSLVGRRVDAWAARAGSDPENAVAALSARSELDHALGEVSYVPARAVVWALPALGFLGTAAEMSRAIGGLGSSVGTTTGYADLRNALVGNVIPPLADAFGVTLFALGASVVCHLLLTWAGSREQRILLDVEEATLELVAANRVPARPAGPAALNGELTSLSQELSMTRTAMTRSAGQVAALDLGQLANLSRLDRLDQLDQLGQLGRLATLLQSVDQRLGQVHAELQRDLVVTRIGAHAPRS